MEESFRGKGKEFMKKIKARIAASAAAVLLALTIVPSAAEAETKEGTPYNSQGEYDVSVPHVTVNQVYGGSSDGAASHSFIELYNETDSQIDLEGWYVACRSGEDGGDSRWELLELTGTIEAEGYYLIRCASTSGTDYPVPQGHQEWNKQLHNKGLSVALFSGEVSLDESFSGDMISGENSGGRPETYVDMLAVQGNDNEPEQAPPAWETGYAPEQSKKRAVRRTADTDNNAQDIEVIDYSEPVEEGKGPHGPEGEGEDQEQTPPEGETYRNNAFEEGAELTLARTGNVTLGTADPEGGVAEIVSYNSDNGRAYVVNGQQGLLNIVPVNEDGSLGPASASVEAADIINEAAFEYGDMTSVAVDTVNDRVAVAIQEKDYRQTGRVALLDYDGNFIRTYETGVQPDMVTVSGDGRYILTADEGEPRNGYGPAETDPRGTVTIIDTEADRTVTVGFESFRSEALEEGILLNRVDGQVIEPEYDFEPEYIALTGDGSTAYVALQEANAIACLDVERAAFTGIKSLGFQDYSQVKADLIEDGKYEGAVYENTLGVRMPDGISVFEAGGVTYIATANEGDAREWGDFSNEEKADIGAAAEKVRVLNHNVTWGLEDGINYLYGSRSFSIFRADTMELVYDSGSQFEEKTARYLESWFNCSNDDTDIDSRSAKKGPEPEAVTVTELGDRIFAFTALERIGGIMVYDVTDPASSKYVNYINTRDFSETVKGDVAPEGMAFVPAEKNPSGKHMLLAACEVSGTLAAYTLGGSASEATFTGDGRPGQLPGDNQPPAAGGEAVSQSRGTSSSEAATGDESPLALIGGLMLLAVVGIAGTVIYETRKNM